MAAINKTHIIYTLAIATFRIFIVRPFCRKISIHKDYPEMPLFVKRAYDRPLGATDTRTSRQRTCGSTTCNHHVLCDTTLRNRHRNLPFHSQDGTCHKYRGPPK